MNYFLRSFLEAKIICACTLAGQMQCDIIDWHAKQVIRDTIWHTTLVVVVVVVQKGAIEDNAEGDDDHSSDKHRLDALD